MPANVEIKAKARDLGRLHAVLRTLTGTSGTVLSQEDTFFHTSQGRLKLRVMGPEYGELIYYEREDTVGPKPSLYVITRSDEPDVLKTVLAAALGVRGVVRKQRTLYLLGQTRVHLDEVEALGDFVELEVVLCPGQPVAAGRQIAQELMRRLEIDDSDLLPGAYIDLLHG